MRGFIERVRDDYAVQQVRQSRGHACRFCGSESGHKVACILLQNVVDFTVTNHGTIYLFRPLTPKAYAWIESNVSDEAQWFGEALVVEHRYARGIAQGMDKDGLRLR